MNLGAWSENSPAALLRAVQHWESRHRSPQDEGSQHFPFTIALSREVGARGTSVARELGKRLGWPVYDDELLELIAKEMKVRVSLLKSVDERRVSWLQECIEAFASAGSVQEASYARHLLETILSLGTHGACIIVGRGAAIILPQPTTLRVRLIGELEDRIQLMSRELGMSQREAGQYVEKVDRERQAFSQEHFHKDVTDPQNYDLVLNSSRLSVSDCAHLIIEALRRLEAAAKTTLGAAAP